MRTVWNGHGRAKSASDEAALRGPKGPLFNMGAEAWPVALHATESGWR